MKLEQFFIYFIKSSIIIFIILMTVTFIGMGSLWLVSEILTRVNAISSFILFILIVSILLGLLVTYDQTQ